MISNKKTGKLIVFEGLDGSGKTTHIKLLTERLRKKGVPVFSTAEPTSSVTGGMLRDALGGITKRSSGEMAALFVLDRIFHNVNPVDGILKMLEEGNTVICDRYYYSSMAYQGSETDYEWVRRMNIDCPEIRKPDACIFLDLDADACMERLGKERDKIEIYENVAKLQSVREKFYKTFELLGESENIHIVNTARPKESVAEEIYSIVEKYL